MRDIKEKIVSNPGTELRFTLLLIKPEVKNKLKTVTTCVMILPSIIPDLSYKNIQNQRVTEKIPKIKPQTPNKFTNISKE